MIESTGIFDSQAPKRVISPKDEGFSESPYGQNVHLQQQWSKSPSKRNFSFRTPENSSAWMPSSKSPATRNMRDTSVQCCSQLTTPGSLKDDEIQVTPEKTTRRTQCGKS